MLNNLTSFIKLNFGNLTAPGLNFAAPFWEFTKSARGSVFQLTTNWIPKGSLISFDNGTFIELIPQQPYFIDFNREIKIRVINPLTVLASAAVIQCDDIEAIIFLERNNYYTQSNDKSFSISYQPTDSTTQLALNPILGARFCTAQLIALSGQIVCYKVTKNSRYGIAAGGRPCVGYLSADQLSAIEYRSDFKALGIELTDEFLMFEPVYSSTVFNVAISLAYSSKTSPELYNESQLYDRKPGLTVDTVYGYNYQIPKHAKNAYVRISDMASNAFQNLWLMVTFINTGLSILLTGAGVSSIGGTIPDWGSASRVRVQVETDLILINDLSIYIGWRN